MADQIDISGLDKADVLAALYNRAKPQGMGFMQYDDKPMDKEAALVILRRFSSFDYLRGRVMKISLDSDTLDPRLYDRDNGEGAAASAIEALRKTGQTNPEEIERQHLEATRNSALDLQSRLDEETTVERKAGYVEVNMGMKDVAPHLKPHLDRVLDDE